MEKAVCGEAVDGSQDRRARPKAGRGGATLLGDPQNETYGDRSAATQDPSGNRWFIATHIKDAHF
jgi:uncharacterized glyoxalase superfamily protein PhnB